MGASKKTLEVAKMASCKVEDRINMCQYMLILTGFSHTPEESGPTLGVAGFKD